MVLSYYLYKYPYIALWHFSRLLGNNIKLAFYCADPLDYEMFQPIQKYLPQMKIIAKNTKVKKYLQEKGISYSGMPAFPDAVIMARQTPYKFPVDKITKIGFDHGLYQFKRWTSPENYNGFDIYFVASSSQVEIARELGINTVEPIGYPKLDNAFNGTYNKEFLSELFNSLKLDRDKKVIIFTTTWDVAGLSALPKWIDSLQELSESYNILVTVHTWTSEKYKSKIKKMRNVVFVEDYNTTPYLMLSDVFVGDYSSIIGEFCALDKPIITFKVPASDRTIPEIMELIETISIQITDVSELNSAIEESLNNPSSKSKVRQEANKLMFFALDGFAGKRAADRILELIK